MADDNQKTPEPAARSRRGRRRPPPTIDLKATDVSPAEPPPEAAAPTETPPPPTSTPEATPEDASANAASPNVEPVASADPPPPEPPEDATATEPPPPPPSPPIWPMLGAAAGGGAIAIAVLLLIWGTPPRNNGSGKQAAQIEKLEAAVGELAAREPPATPNPSQLATLSGRVTQLEAAGSAAPPPSPNPQLAQRLAAIERTIGSLSDDAAALKQRSDAAVTAAQAAQRQADSAVAKTETMQAAGAQGAVADRQDIATLNTRLAALERTAQTLQADLAEQRSDLIKQRDARSDDRVVRLAIVAEMLKAAVIRGDSFRVELDAAKALAPDPAALAPVEAFADSGIPTASALAQKLRTILPAMRKVVTPKADGNAGFLERLQVNAERLVRIQPIGEPRGDDAEAILARIEAKLGRSDIAGALSELNTLPPDVRASAQDWVKTANARDAAIAASRQFAAAHVGALAGRSD